MFEGYFKNLVSLREDEDIKLIVHHHWLTFASAFLKIIIPPVGILVFIYMFGFVKFLNLLNSPIFSWIFLISFIIWATFAFYSWFVWFFDVGIMTNQRIIVIEQKALFEKSISEASLDRIQDITTHIAGLSSTLLGYGSIIIQTAGEATNLAIKNVPKPQKIQQKILHIKNTETETETEAKK